MGVYVIGLTPSWVEFRQGIEKPKAIRSEAVKTILVPSTWPNNARGKVEQRSVTFKRVCWEGGKVLGTMERSDYNDLIGFPDVEVGACTTLGAQSATKVQDASWRKVHNII